MDKTTTLPRILIKMEGSVLPHIAPQLLIVAGLGALSIFWNPLRGQTGDENDESLKLQPAMSVRAHREHGLPLQCSRFAKPMLILEVPQPARSEITPCRVSQVVGILLSFLMVFKTQNAFGQFWEASRDIGHAILTRHLCRLTVTSFEWTDHDGLSEEERKAAELRSMVRKVLRLLVPYFFAVVEYFQRTGDEKPRAWNFKP